MEVLVERNSIYIQKIYSKIIYGHKDRLGAAAANQAKLHKSDIRAINKLIKQICGDNLNELNIYKRQSAK